MDKHFVLVAKVTEELLQGLSKEDLNVVPSFVTFYYTALNYATLRYVTTCF